MQLISVFFLLVLATTAATCTAQNPPTRIVGGIPVNSITQYPWMASLQIATGSNSGSGGGLFCGGSLIAPNMLVTAAHCTMQHIPLSSITVSAHRLFILSKTSAMEKGIDFDVIQVISHPNYSQMNGFPVSPWQTHKINKQFHNWGPESDYLKFYFPLSLFSLFKRWMTLPCGSWNNETSPPAPPPLSDHQPPSN